MADTVTAVALCWRLERRDGVTIGLTGHDRDLFVDGLWHRAAPGMVPSAIARSDGLDPDTMDASGPLTSGAISEADLVAGRWDGARISVFALDWEADGEPMSLGIGTLGAVETKAGGFTAELQGLAAALAGPVNEETSPDCRADLGDPRCRVPMPARRRIARVAGAAEEVLTLDSVEAGANLYANGVLRFLTGANCGLESAVAASAGASVTLRAPPMFVPEPGALVRLTEGCDKTLATCAARFGNAVNFRGEPFLPGIDLLTRYPGA